MLPTMRESDLLASILRDPPPLGHGDAAGARLDIGPGDDLAQLTFPGGQSVLIGVDQVVDGVHVDSRSQSWHGIARKAVHRCVSDVAAMAARPIASVISVTFPADCTQDDAEMLRRGLGDTAADAGAPLVGGDIAVHAAAGPLTISVTVLAVPGDHGVVRRDGAQVGDGIWVSGQLGATMDASGGGHHLAFMPRTDVAAALHAHLGADLHAMIDISDGLGRDAGRIAAASQVGIELDATSVPCRGSASWRAALGDGEDYELCFAAAADAQVPSSMDSVALTQVGRVVAGSGIVVVTPEGERLDGADLGWDHDGRSGDTS